MRMTQSCCLIFWGMLLEKIGSEAAPEIIRGELKGWKETPRSVLKDVLLTCLKRFVRGGNIAHSPPGLGLTGCSGKVRKNDFLVVVVVGSAEIRAFRVEHYPIRRLHQCGSLLPVVWIKASRDLVNCKQIFHFFLKHTSTWDYPFSSPLVRSCVVLIQNLRLQQ